MGRKYSPIPSYSTHHLTTPDSSLNTKTRRTSLKLLHITYHIASKPPSSKIATQESQKLHYLTHHSANQSPLVMVNPPLHHSTRLPSPRLPARHPSLRTNLSIKSEPLANRVTDQIYDILVADLDDRCGTAA
jgi:hypothetical protein